MLQVFTFVEDEREEQKESFTAMAFIRGKLCKNLPFRGIFGYATTVKRE